VIKNVVLEELAKSIKKEFGDVSKLAIVADGNVAVLYGESLQKELVALGLEVELLTFAAGEENKNLITLEELAAELLNRNFDRNSLIVALGGGVTGDLAGFLASIYMRGVKFVQVPTSLLAMVDASIGGKTGVDTKEGKNLLGTFYQAEAIYMVPEFLQTLPKVELVSGLAEVVKHGLIKDIALLDYLKNNREAILAGEILVLKELVTMAAAVKLEIVAMDEKEHGVRKYLNVGHTVGHALEHLSGYKIKHGEAVSLGIVVESMISKELGYLSETDFAEIVKILELCELPITLNAKFTVEAMWQVMQFDKKNLDGAVIFALVEKLGQAVKIAPIDQSLFTKIWQQFYA